MEEMPHLKEMEWIFDGTLPLSSSRSPDWTGNFVLHLIPDCFEGYVKVFHAVYEDPSMEGSSETWDEIDKDAFESSKSIDGMPEGLLELHKKSILLYRSADSSSELKRVFWKELAEEMGLVFHSEIYSSSFTRRFPNRSWPRYLLGPSEGYLDNASLESLVTVLSKNVPAQNWYFYYDLSATRSHEQPILYRSGLVEFFERLPSLMETNVYGSPTYWFPDDKSCLVNSDWDLTCTYIGGKDRICEKVLSHPQIEAIEVELDSRIDYYSDQVNF